MMLTEWLVDNSGIRLKVVGPNSLSGSKKSPPKPEIADRPSLTFGVEQGSVHNVY